MSAAQSRVIERDREAGPTPSRMLLGAQLRRLREAAEITREDAAQVIRASGSKISRLELGRVSFKPRDVDDLLDLYGVDDPAELAALRVLSEQANAPAWWYSCRNVVPEWLEEYLGLEPAASIIRTYDVQFIPDLLQTPEYARAMLRFGYGEESLPDLDQRVSLRMQRQQILRRPDPPRLWAVIDEAALRRPVGGSTAMRAQIRHLMEAVRLRHITLQVMPLKVGRAIAGGPITVLRFREGTLPDEVYLEQLDSALYLTKPAETVPYWSALNRLVTQARPPSATPAILREIFSQT
jgi:transcriptional regulator with XRE-family HTH domain